MDGDYEVDDLGGLLAVATANAHNIQVRPCPRRRPFSRSHSRPRRPGRPALVPC